MHDKGKFYECYAKVILETLLPDTFSGLELSDKPDLIDRVNNIGIEVVGGNSSQAMRVYSELSNVANGIQVEKKVRLLSSLGVVQSPLWWYYETETSIESIVAAFEAKICKLNEKQYELFPRYDLFIHTFGLFELDQLAELLSMFIRRNTGDLTFSCVYLLMAGYLGVYDLVQSTLEWIELPRASLALAERAQSLFFEQLGIESMDKK